MNPLISVIIPVYNVENYIHTCIDSVLAQTYTNLEIILVDDGSPDECPKICDEYAKRDSRIKVIHKENGGLSDARNAGLDIATGEYIGFIDSDDVILPNMYQTMLDTLLEQNADICVCQFFRINELGYVINKEECRYSEDCILLSGEECFNYNYFDDNGWCTVPATNKLYTSNLWDDLRFEKGKIHEDEFAFHKIMLKCSYVAILNKSLYGYRINDSGIMANRNVKTFLNAVEAFLSRGLDCLDVMNKRWHTANVSIACRDFKKAIQVLQTQQDNANCNIIKNNIIKYANLIYKTKKLSISNLLRMYGEIKFPKIYKLIKKPFLKIKGLKRWLLLRKKVKQSDILLLNTITHGNLGDHAIVLAEQKMLGELFPTADICELTGIEFDRNRKRLSKIVSKKMHICVNGGGNIGCLWPEEERRLQRIITTFSKNNIIFFPQTATFDMLTDEGRRFFEESKKVYFSHRNLTIFVREQKSFDFMKENMPKVDCRLVPDIVLSYSIPIEQRERNGVLLCLRADIEKALDEVALQKILNIVVKKYSKEDVIFTDTVVEHDVQICKRQQAVQRKLEQFAGAKLIITDRLHGMIFAFLSKTPCIAMGNINGKVGAVYQWFCDCPYVKYINSTEELSDALATLEGLTESDMNYTFDIEKFAPLCDIIRKEMNNLL